MPIYAALVTTIDGPCATRSRPSPPRRSSCSAPTSPTSTGPCSRWSTSPRRSRARMFARYSRYAGTVRRLYLEEFAGDVPDGGRPFDGDEGERAAKLYTNVFLGYGDDSIAQVGGRPHRLRVGLEHPHQDPPAGTPGRLPRAVDPLHPLRPADAGDDGGYRYYSDDQLGPEFRTAMDELFTIYSGALETVQAWAAERWPRGDDEPEKAWQSSIRAKALDLCRGLLPAATLSHVGIFASGQAYEQLLLRMLASPLPEAREFAGMILEELKQVMPSFVARVDRPDRGGEWIELPERSPRGHRALGRAPRPRPPRYRRRPFGRADRGRGRRGGPAGRLAVRVLRAIRGGDSRAPHNAPSRRAGQRRSPSSPASAPTAATAPAAAGRRSATGSRSSPTTAASATSSATGC